MYSALLHLHSYLRWLLLFAVVACSLSSYIAILKSYPYNLWHSLLRILMGIFAHTQLLVGLSLYLVSPVPQYFLRNSNDTLILSDIGFFSVLHPVLMFFAIVLLTLGSSLVKREPIVRNKHRLMFAYSSISLIIILLSIPWPFHLLAARPFIRF